MDRLKQKIQNTVLFSSEEKIEILTAMDDFSEYDLKELESIIDEYNEKYTLILKTFKANVIGELDSIVSKADLHQKKQLSTAADTIRQGLDVVVATQ